MYGFQINQSLQLHNDLMFNDEIGTSGSNVMTFIEYIMLRLAIEMQSCLCHLYGQTSLIYYFLKTIAHSAMDFHGAPIHLIRYGIPLISAHHTNNSIM